MREFVGNRECLFGFFIRAIDKGDPMAAASHKTCPKRPVGSRQLTRQSIFLEPTEYRPHAELRQQHNGQRHGLRDRPAQVPREWSGCLRPNPESAREAQRPTMEQSRLASIRAGMLNITIPCCEQRAEASWPCHLKDCLSTPNCLRKRIGIDGKLGCDPLNIVLKGLFFSCRCSAQPNRQQRLPQHFSAAASLSLLSPSLF